MAKTRLFGYADPLNPKAGTRVDFMVSAEGFDTVDARLVRILHSDENPQGPVSSRKRSPRRSTARWPCTGNSPRSARLPMPRIPTAYSIARRISLSWPISTPR